MGRINVTSRIFAGALVPNKANIEGNMGGWGGYLDRRASCKLPRPLVLCPLCCFLCSVECLRNMLEEARKLTSSREILLWMTPSEAPKALQASECSELLDPMRASCWIFAQH
jgi:hypothetical protein